MEFPVIPLLHAGQTMLRVTTLDSRVLAGALAVFAIAAVSIWLPASTFRRRGPGMRRRSALHAALIVFVFLAVLPSVIPYDHLLPAASHSGSVADDETVHSSHCHVSPATCSDAPVTSGPGQLLMGNPLIAAPAMLSILVLLTLPALASITTRPRLQPPLSASLV